MNVMDTEHGRKRTPPDLIPSGTIRDFLLPIVEFLGILVPGIIFILAAFPALVIPSVAIIKIIETGKVVVPIISDELAKSILDPNSIKLFILLVLSYVIGHIFFRQDPKIPDTKSFDRVPSDIKKDGPVRLCDNEIEYNKEKYGEEIGKNKKHNMEFPYRYLFEYLNDRGMPHLAEKITWKGENPKTYKNRTKHFINILKVHLEFLFPYQYTRIQRNEAHVRLMSSMWYSSKSIISISIVGCFLGGISIYCVYKINNTIFPMPYVSAIFWPILSLVSALMLKIKIEGFLHYQRIREIVFIMEAAHFASQLYPEFNIGGAEFTKSQKTI
jgi:hypothetical protein